MFKIAARRNAGQWIPACYRGQYTKGAYQAAEFVPKGRNEDDRRNKVNSFESVI